GALFIEGAERIVATAGETARAVRAAQDGVGQTLRIGMTQTAAYQVVASALSAFRDRHRRAAVRLFESKTAELERRLEQNALDVAFLHPPLHAPGLTEKTLAQTPMTRVDFADPRATARPTVAYPRSEAPVLMGVLARSEDDETGDFPAAEADTMLCAMVLSRAGYGRCVLPGDYAYSAVRPAAMEDAVQTEFLLETAIARRSLDRRPIIRDLVDCAVAAGAR
ncbi:MAG: LysR substrate-binding domain-containing protein, partial [Pseudomonadota bacterium]